MKCSLVFGSFKKLCSLQEFLLKWGPRAFITHLVSDGFLGREVEAVHLWKLSPQVVVQFSELGIPSVDVPLVVQDTDVDLEGTKHPSLSTGRIKNIFWGVG